MAMDSRTNFLVQLLQKLGAPLMGAVSVHSSGDEAKDAQTMAALLSESVKAGIALSQAMNLKTDDGDADAIRVSLATLAGGLIADSYKQNGRVPGDAEGRRIQKSLEAVIVFADNFAPAAEHAQRLQTLEATPPFFDPVQTNIYAIHALIPAISAISEFSFGQEGGRLIQDVSDRIGAKAKEMLTKLGANSNTMDELVILQALGQIYAGAHRTETQRLKSAGDQDGAATLEAVWKSFDLQVAMLDVLLSSMGGSSSGATRSGSGSVKPAIENQAEEPTAPVQPPPAPPAAPPPAAPPAQGGNPMSFFKKK